MARPPSRKTSASARRRKRRSIGWRLRLGFSLAAAVVAVLAWAALARTLAPASNTALNRFDAIIVLGNRFVEARVMARSAQAQGIPESALLEDTQARDTVENACYSLRIMKDHGWRSAEIVSSAYQLPRAGLIFNSLPLQWSAHEAPPVSPQSPAYDKALASVEVLKTARYLIWSRWAERCEP